MKKFLLASLMIAGLSTLAFAQQGGMGMGPGGGNNGACPCPMGGQDGYGRGMHGHRGDMKNAPQPTVKTADEAKAKVQEVIKTDFKGYKITKTEEFTGRHGYSAFRIMATDAGGNEFIFHVNPFGNVRGPMLAKNMPAAPGPKGQIK